MDARHTRELGFDYLLRHFFKNLNQYLALQGPPGGQTVRHHLPASTKPVVNLWRGQSRGGVTWDGQSGSGENNHESHNEEEFFEKINIFFNK